MKAKICLAVLAFSFALVPSGAWGQDLSPEQWKARAKLYEKQIERLENQVKLLEAKIKRLNEQIDRLQKSDSSTADESAYDVVRVIDGDTIVVKIEGEDTKVRLVGVDTPETVHPSKPVQEYGKEASAFLKNLLAGEKVFLGFEAEEAETDKYGRTLAYVYRAPDRLFVNAEIVRQGYGNAYTRFPFKHMAEFRKLESQAREAGRGLWASSSSGSPDSPREESVTSEDSGGVSPNDSEDADSQGGATSPPPSGSDDPTVYVTRTGSKYHLGSCSYLKKSKIAKSLSEARQRYSPCSRCRPPK